MSHESLKRCPFCGARVYGPFGPSEGEYRIECSGGDDPRAPVCGDWYYPADGDGSEAIAAWNRRAEPIATVEHNDDAWWHKSEFDMLGDYELPRAGNGEAG